MAKVFIGIALVFMLATAGLGFVLKGNIDKLQSALTATKGKITTAEGKARAAKAMPKKRKRKPRTPATKPTRRSKPPPPRPRKRKMRRPRWGKSRNWWKA